MPAFAKDRTPEQSYVAKRTPLAFAWLLIPLLLAVINPLLFTAHADGGTPAIVPVLQTVFTNPTPAVDDRFGFPIALVGTDRVLVGTPSDDTGAPNSGAAYLFNMTGVLLTTFTNPTPAASDQFGSSVAAVGSNFVLMGTIIANAETGAYLYSTDGTLVRAFTDPTPSPFRVFGHPLAALGTDRILIGMLQQGSGSNFGAIYLYRTNGALLTTFTNPVPTAEDLFGISLVTVGSDRVLIGSGAGPAYLFDTNGVILTTFTNPAPAAIQFTPQTAIGDDRLLFADLYDDTGAQDAGIVYLFNVNGTLLTTFTNPTPAQSDLFGYSVAALGTDQVLIGAAFDDTGGANAGAVYLFRTNGDLLMTLTNPAPMGIGRPPAITDDFGWSLKAAGNDRFFASARSEDIGATNAGVVYLYALVPSLGIRSTSTNTLTVSWPSFVPDFKLQHNTNGIATLNWSNVTDTVQDDGTNKYIIVNPATGNRFYRLSKP